MNSSFMTTASTGYASNWLQFAVSRCRRQPEADRQIMVDIDPEKLLARGLTPLDSSTRSTLKT